MSSRGRAKCPVPPSKAPMKDSPGTSSIFSHLKFISNKIGSMLYRFSSPNTHKRLDSKLGKKIAEVKDSTKGNETFKSINSIIIRFPQFREELKDIKGVFEEYDEDSNGAIDRKELKKCLQKLQVNLTEEEVEDLFRSCDIDKSEGIQFNEFIVLLCLIYLLKEPSSAASKLGWPQLEATFNAIIKVFLFFDKNGDGKLNEKEIFKALNEASRWEKSPAFINQTRFKEMDRDKNGLICFREFLFGFLKWVGIDTDEEMLHHET